MNPFRACVGVGLITLTCVGAAQVPIAQVPGPALQVLHPSAETELFGVTTLSAQVVPVEAVVRHVEFIVDGRPACIARARPFRCDWDAADSRTPRSVRVVAVMGDGSRLVQTVRTKGSEALVAFRSRVDMIPVPVLVTDGRRFIRGLTQGDFRIREGDTIQRIAFFEDGFAPAEIVVALDVSGSMAGVLPDLRSATRGFLESLRPSDAVTLTAFNTRLSVLAGRDAPASERLAALERLRPGGTTALFDVLLQAIDIAKKRSGRRAVVVFTDGEDTTSRASLQRVRAALLQADVTLYLLVRERPDLQHHVRDQLVRLADETGGSAVFAKRMSGLREQFSTILEQLSNQYVLTYTPAQPLGDGVWRKIDVELVGNARRYDFKAREGYFAVARVSGEMP